MGFSGRFPRWVTAIIGLIQLVCTAAIIGLEIGSNYIDLAHGTIWVGFWAGIIFIKAALMMLFITCCCRGRCCSFYVLLLNVFSGLLACLVIYFDRLFIEVPCKCYLTDQMCCAIGGISSLQNNYQTALSNCATNMNPCPSAPYDKLSLLKAQLAAAVVMLVSNTAYAALFLFACFGVCFGGD